MMGTKSFHCDETPTHNTTANILENFTVLSARFFSTMLRRAWADARKKGSVRSLPKKGEIVHLARLYRLLKVKINQQQEKYPIT